MVTEVEFALNRVRRTLSVDELMAAGEILASEVERLQKVERAAQSTVNAYEAYGFGPAVEQRVRLLRATIEVRP